MDLVLPFLFIFIFGAIIGSFVNVLIYRFGFIERARHRSSCQSCAAELRWFELLPILSFVALRGRCARCGSRISAQYPLVELLMGILFVATYTLLQPLEHLVDGVLLLLFFSFWAFFVAIVVYDIRHTLVPTHFATALLLSAGAYTCLLAFSMSEWRIFFDGVIGAFLLGGIIFLLVLLTRMRGMGVGDIAIASAMGLLLGWWDGFDALILSFWIGAFVGVSLVILARFSPFTSLLGGAHQITIKSEVPFVPFLFVGTCVVLFSDISSFVLVDAILSLML